MIRESDGSINVLFIVSDPNSIESFSKEFLVEGFLVMATDNEYDATKYVLGGGYSLILLDVSLRGDEGMKILKWIRWNEKTKHIASVPVVMFTDSVDEKIKNEAKELGVLDSIVSPKSTPKQIANQIKEILDKLK